METMIFFVPETALFKGGSFEDLIYGGKRVRIIYHKHDLNRAARLIFSLKIKKLTADAKFFLNEFSEKFKGEKIYRSGHDITLCHLPQIIKIAAPKKPVVIFSATPSHIQLLKPLIMSQKNISFVTHPRLIEEFSEKLLTEYGISGGAAEEVNLRGRVAVLMPGGENFSPQGADTIINLSKCAIAWRNISPENILFSPPSFLKNAKHIFRHADTLETALSFFNADFSEAVPISVKINKQKVLRNE